MNLTNVGFNQYIEAQFNSIGSKGEKIARVTGEYQNIYKIISKHGTKLAEISGKMKYEAEKRSDYPVVGDWVIIRATNSSDKSIIKKIIPRQTKVLRNVAGKRTEEQIIAANIDYIFIVNGLDNDFNIRRIERYLTITWDSGASPVIILNKSDLCTEKEIEKKKTRIENSALAVPVHVIGCKEKKGLSILDQYFENGKTTALLGSSGVGKSTLINQIIGRNKQKTNETRGSDGKGKHTTTSREMIMIPDGGVIIDTPGMREIQLLGNDEGLNSTFSDIMKISNKCRFNDCTHTHEPGCAVKKAIADGEMKKERLENYHKMKRELRYQKLKEMKSADNIEYEKWYEITKHSRRKNRY